MQAASQPIVLYCARHEIGPTLAAAVVEGSLLAAGAVEPVEDVLDFEIPVAAETPAAVAAV